MLSHSEWLSLTLATGAAATFDRAWLSAQQPLIMRAVPSSNERLPIVGARRLGDLFAKGAGVRCDRG